MKAFIKYQNNDSRKRFCGFIKSAYSYLSFYFDNIRYISLLILQIINLHKMVLAKTLYQQAFPVYLLALLIPALPA